MKQADKTYILKLFDEGWTVEEIAVMILMPAELVKEVVLRWG